MSWRKPRRRLDWETPELARFHTYQRGLQFEITAYRATTGLSLMDVVILRPWRWLPMNQRKLFLRLACRRLRMLFRYQHVVKAEMV
jgi:hypothetical protein